MANSNTPKSIKSRLETSAKWNKKNLKIQSISWNLNNPKDIERMEFFKKNVPAETSIGKMRIILDFYRKNIK